MSWPPVTRGSCRNERTWVDVGCRSGRDIGSSRANVAEKFPVCTRIPHTTPKHVLIYSRNVNTVGDIKLLRKWN